MKSPFVRFGLLLLGLLLVALALSWHGASRGTSPLRITQVDRTALRGSPSKSGRTANLNKPADILEKAEQARERVSAGLRTPEQARQQIAGTLLARMTALAAERARIPAPPPLHGKARGYGRRVLDPLQQSAIDELYSLLGPGAELQLDQVDATVRHLRGDLSKAIGASPEFLGARARGDYPQMAIATLSAISRVMNIRDPSAEFTPQAPGKDELSMVHVKLDQTFNDVPVFGGQVVVHFDAAGDPIQIDGVYAPTPKVQPPNLPVISEESALALARQAVKAVGPGLREPRIERKYYWEPNVSPALAYQVDLVPALNESWHVFISVADGSVLHVVTDVCAAAVAGQGQDILGQTRTVTSWQDGNAFLAIDTSLPMYDAARSRPPSFTNLFGAIAIFDAKNQARDFQEVLETGISYAASNNKDSWDPTVVSVMSGFSRVYDYYKSTHNRNSFDDQGISLIGVIHCQFLDPSGRLYKDNAFFTGALKMMVFGDGEKTFGAGKLPAGLDVTGHELTHGVVFSTADLIYENQSGALNEHLADYFGCMVDRQNWYLGEDACIGTAKLRLRDMTDPHSPDAIANQPKMMSEFRNLPNTPQGDHGGVHDNSGIVNYASYLFTDGPQGIGRVKAERIVYRALTKYLTKYSQFIDYRHAILSSAQDLYPDGSTTNAIVQAFNTVGILEGDATPPPTPVPPSSGVEQAVYLRAETDFLGSFTGYGLYLLDGRDIFPVASQFVAKARPAVSGDGQWGLYIGADNNVYWTDGIQEEAWTQTRDVRTIALSKDQRYIAFTTTDYDDTIAIIDTTDGNVVTAVLRVPTTGSGSSASLDFADVLAFNCTGDTLIFDGFTQLTIGQGTYGTWGLFGLRVKDQACFSLLPPAADLQIGDPSMAHTLPYTLLANYVFTDDQGETTLGMVTLDLANDNLSVLLSGLNQLPNPSFRGDDRKVVFASFNSDGLYYLNEATLTADRTALAPNSVVELIWSQNVLAYPVAFRAGTYTPPAGTLSVNAGSLSFGTVNVGQAAVNSLVLTNSGNADLELISATVEGAEGGAYDFTSPIGKRMSVGDSQVIGIKFAPARLGPLAASLRFKTTAPNQPDVVVSLSGTGLQPATGPRIGFTRVPNGIQLTWAGGGTLESADRLTGAWTPVPNSASPKTVSATGSALFFRVRQ